MIALAAAACSGRFTFLPPNRRIEFRLVALACIVVAIVYASLSCLRYYQMLYGLWDFGIYDSILHNTAFGKGFMRDYRGPFDHFSPAVLVMVPFYWLFDNPLVLVFFQSAVMAAAAVPLYLLARQYFRKPGIPLLLTSMYILNPYYSRIALYDFHIECLFPLVFFSAWLAFARRRLQLFTLILLCLPLIKEDFVIPLAACGLFLCFRRNTLRHGVICLAAALLWSVFVLKVWFPVTMGAQYQHYGRFPPVLGNGFMDTVYNLCFIAGQCFSLNSIAVFCSVLLPFAFLPVFSPRSFLWLLCPVVFIQFCTTFLHQQLLMSHYSSAVIGVTPIAAIFGIRVLRMLARKIRLSPQLRKYSFRFAACLLVVTHVAFCEMPQLKYHSYIPVYRTDRQLGFMSLPFNVKVLNYPRAALFHEIKDSIPQTYSVCTQNNLGVFFLRHKAVYWITKPQNPDFYVFDLKSFDGFDSVTAYQNLIAKVAEDHEYMNIYKFDGFLIFCRKSLLLPPLKK